MKKILKRNQNTVINVVALCVVRHSFVPKAMNQHEQQAAEIRPNYSNTHDRSNYRTVHLTGTFIIPLLRFYNYVD
jgi:hypothetical protein